MKLLTLFLTLILAVAAASADESPAKRFFMSAQKHFDLGEYADALKDFKEAYRVREDPVFIYNIAQCQRLLGQNVDAIRSYKSYLRRSPDAPNRVEVERKITALEEQRLAQPKPETPAPKPIEQTTPKAADLTPATPIATENVVATAPPPHKPVYKQWWLWTAVGAVVVVGVGVGLGVGLSSSSKTQFPSVGF